MNKVPEKITPATGELRILLLEDSDLDTNLIEEELGNSCIKFLSQHVADEASFKTALDTFSPDIILSDFCLPSYDGFLALDEVRGRDSEVPFIFVSGAIGEDLAIEALKRGATDCVNKGHLGKLAGAVRRAIDESREQHKRLRAEEALERLRLRNLIILDSAAEGIAGLDNEMRFVFINRAGLDMLGYGISDLVGEPMDTVIDQRPQPDGFIPAQWSDIAGILPDKNVLVLRRRDGSIFKAEFTVSSMKEDSIRPGLVLSFKDITDRLKSEEEIRNGYERLRKILFESIHAMSTALEFRDPYTAGHQKRVAELASAMSRLLGLTEDRTDGIYLAGIVHDIGKIYVPAEILTRPGKLTDVEFMMIQGHSETGYQILKDVDYPWPIAQAVYQHHERMDGSGYPRGLSGDDIILEARIIAVADVMEAMASHRPYRPALGTEIALAEIRKGAVKIYDGEVAKACLSLFAEGFAFS
jgi:PAS domain S-box-containing protein/putative nucleotidyltransferase with HDIG domain